MSKYFKLETKTQELVFLVCTLMALLLFAACYIYLKMTPAKIQALTGVVGSLTLEKIFNWFGYSSFYIGLSSLWLGQFTISKIFQPQDIQKYYRKFIYFVIAQVFVITLIASFLSIYQAVFQFISHKSMLFGAGGLFGLKVGGGLFNLFGAFGSVSVLAASAMVLSILTGLFSLTDIFLFIDDSIKYVAKTFASCIKGFAVFILRVLHTTFENNMFVQKLLYKFNKFVPELNKEQETPVELNDLSEEIELDGHGNHTITSLDSPKGLISYYPAESIELATEAAKKTTKTASKKGRKAKPAEEATKEQAAKETENKGYSIDIKAWTKKYTKPELQLLNKPTKMTSMSKTQLEQSKTQLLEHLESFGISGDIIEVHEGPTLAMYEMQLKAGVKLSKIASLTDDLAMALGAPSIRILAPIPGKTTIGIEIPNQKKRVVNLSELMKKVSANKDENLPIPMGMNVNNETIIHDLTKMPHMLVSGTTGSGKSVYINTLISSLIFTKSPKELRFLMIDPKMIELSPYNGIPHLLKPVVTDVNEAKNVLQWAEKEMDRRYQLLAEVGSKDITSFNKFISSEKKSSFVKKKKPSMDFEWAPLPYLVIIIDELADLMMTQGKEVETPITRIAQKARACGIHMVIATQRPSSDIITGLIKTNFPTRVACKVSSSIDSRTILDSSGAEKLFGHGDMLFLPNGKTIQRLQSAFISEDEVKKLVKQSKKSS